MVAGGTDVYPAYASRPIDRPVLDITALPGLRGVPDDGDAWRIPALTTWTDLAEAAAARRVRRAPGRGPDDRRAPDPECRDRVRERRERLAGRRLDAQPAGARRRGGGRVGLGSPDRPDRGIRAREPADGPAGRRARHGPPGAEAHRGERRFGGRRPVHVPQAWFSGVPRDLDRRGRRDRRGRGGRGDGRAGRGRGVLAGRAAAARPRGATSSAGGPTRPLATWRTAEHLSELAPIDDVRGTAGYRLDAALTLVRRAIAEVAA